MSAPEFAQKTITVGQSRVNVIESGLEHQLAVVLLHGWPQDATAWRAVMQLACKQVHAIAINLPGVGGSTAVSGRKSDMAQLLHEVIGKLELDNYFIVGHDIGAMVAFAYARQFPDELKGAVLMDSAIPGIDPWDSVVANPHIWHFAFHAVPSLPEALVTGKQQQYFDFFFNALTKNKAAITTTARQQYASTYTPPAALGAGFDWYRAFDADAADNQRKTPQIHTPFLYIRGADEGGHITDYKHGFEKAGMAQVTTATIPDSGHFTLEENPQAVWQEIAHFMGL